MPERDYMYSPLTPEGRSALKQDARWLALWRGINFIFVLFFLLAAVANLNDDDNYIWVPIYAVPALLSLAILIDPQVSDNNIWQLITVTHMTICAVGALYLLIIVTEHFIKKLSNPLEHEEGREFAGLLITEAWLFVCRFTSVGSSEPGKGGMKMLLLITGVLAVIPLFVWGLCFFGGLHKELGHCKDMFKD